MRKKAQKIKLIEGVDVYINVKTQKLKFSKAEKHSKCKGETRLSKLQHDRSTQDISHSPPKF